MACRSRRKESKQPEITWKQLEPVFLRSRKEENLYGHCDMNNARRILSKGFTPLRCCWFWSKNLHFQKNFGRNFIAVEGVRNIHILGRILTEFTGLLRTNNVAAKRDLLTERTVVLENQFQYRSVRTGLSCRIAPIWPLSQLSLCIHNPTSHSLAISWFSQQVVLVFLVNTIRQLILPSSGTLVWLKQTCVLIGNQFTQISSALSSRLNPFSIQNPVD